MWKGGLENSTRKGLIKTVAAEEKESNLSKKFVWMDGPASTKMSRKHTYLQVIEVVESNDPPISQHTKKKSMAFTEKWGKISFRFQFFSLIGNDFVCFSLLIIKSLFVSTLKDWKAWIWKSIPWRDNICWSVQEITYKTPHTYLIANEFSNRTANWYIVCHYTGFYNFINLYLLDKINSYISGKQASRHKNIISCLQKIDIHRC